jgi:deoxyadenosine/deoxycytidine kinase
MFENRHPQYNRFKSLKGSVFTIEGTIGVGKTTLGRSVESYLNEIGLSAKFFPEYVNIELLDQYIYDMKRYAYTFQMVMLCKRIEIYRKAEQFAQNGGVALVDRSIIGDLTFAQMQYDSGNFSTSEWETYRSLMRQEIQLVPTGSLYLRCAPETSLVRVKARGIETEVKGYTVEYMKMLNDAYEKSIAQCTNVRHIIIDWNDPIPVEAGKIGLECVHRILDLMIITA